MIAFILLYFPEWSSINGESLHFQRGFRGSREEKLRNFAPFAIMSDIIPRRYFLKQRKPRGSRNEPKVKKTIPLLLN